MLLHSERILYTHSILALLLVLGFVAIVRSSLQPRHGEGWLLLLLLLLLRALVLFPPRRCGRRRRRRGFHLPRHPRWAVLRILRHSLEQANNLNVLVIQTLRPLALPLQRLFPRPLRIPPPTSSMIHAATAFDDPLPALLPITTFPAGTAVGCCPASTGMTPDGIDVTTAATVRDGLLHVTTCPQRLPAANLAPAVLNIGVAEAAVCGHRSIAAAVRARPAGAAAAATVRALHYPKGGWCTGPW